MSRRRGAASKDPAAIERRQWYADMQALAFKGGNDEKDETIVAEDKMSILTGKDDISTLDGISTVTGDKSQPTMMSFGTFNSLAVNMFDESVAAAKARSEEPKQPKIIYTKAPDFNPLKWIVRLSKRKDSSAPVECLLLCFHGLAGNPQLFRHWAMQFQETSTEVMAVCLPGRGNRAAEPAMEHVVEICGSIVDALCDLGIVDSFRSRRIVFFGHSVGAIIAFEVAMTLQKINIYISHFIVSAAIAPETLTEYNSDRFGTKYFCCSEPELMDRLKKLGGVHPIITSRRDLQRQCLELLRADYKVYEKYTMDSGDCDDDESKIVPLPTVERLECPMTVFGTQDDVTVTEEHLQEWGKQSNGCFVQCMFYCGGHSYLQTYPDNESVVFSMTAQICAGDDQPEFNPPKNPAEIYGTFY